MKKLILIAIFATTVAMNFVSANYTENEVFSMIFQENLVIKNKIGDIDSIKVYKDQVVANKMLETILDRSSALALKNKSDIV